MEITYRALCEVEQGGDEIVIVAVIVVCGWTRGGGSGSGCSLWLLWAVSLFLCRGLTGVWSQHSLLHHLCPSRTLCLRPL